MARHPALDATAQCVAKRVVSRMHVDELSVAANGREFDRMKSGRLGRDGVVGVIGVIALARDVDAPVLQLVLIGDVMHQWAFRNGKSRVVLRENLAEEAVGASARVARTLPRS